MSRPLGIDHPVIDLRKLEDYCLSPDHLKGRHKARVFREALGIGREHAQWLKDHLLEGLATADALEIANDAFGTRWRIDIKLARQRKQAVVRTLWIIRTGEESLRFVTCWVL
ncbi:MAG TPA: hypothetical protein VMS78_03215 [Rhizomicrobium sp.]|nr:hypothetical protein [Rhizomicrobium sp.]